MKLLLITLLFSVQSVLILCDIPFDYCSLNDNVCEGIKHIACGPVQNRSTSPFYEYTLRILLRVNITTVALSDSEKLSILNFSNAECNKIALGQTVLPKGSNLPKTIWDEELELFAKSLAELPSLVIEPDQFCFKRRDGKTVYPKTLLDTKHPLAAQDAIRNILEDTKTNVENVVNTDALKEHSFLSKMGCIFGIVTIDSNIYKTGLSCVVDFGVERNVVGNLYAEGEPCSTCKNDVGCDSEFTGLCATN